MAVVTSASETMRDVSRIALIAMALAGLVSRGVAAQTENRLLAEYTLASWTDRDNLPSARIWALEQDDSGYLWVGNDVGIFRFDGVRFMPLEALTRLPGSDRPIAMMVASSGGLWIGFDSGSIGHLLDGQLRLYTQREGAPGDGTFAFLEDHEGTVWACSGEGVSRLRGDRWEPLDSAQGLPAGPILTMFEDRSHQLWVASRTTVFKRSAASTGFEQVGLVDSAGFLGPWFSQDAAGHIWMTDRRQGFRRVDGSQQVRTPDVRGSGVNLIHDRKGALWLATPGYGLWRARQDPSGREVSVDTMTTRDGLLSDAVRALHEDREGNIWVGTYSGLQRLSPRRVASVTEFGIARTLTVAPDGSLWIVAASGLVHRTESGARVFTERDGLPGPTVLAAHFDEHGVLWVGTDRGVARLVGDRFVPLRVSSGTELSRPLTIAGRKETWVRDSDQGWFHWTDGVLKPGAPFGASDRGATSIRFDRRERLWLGATGSVTISDPATESVRTIDLPVGRVSTMYESRSGDMWVAGSAGLSLISDTRVTSIGRQNGLPANVFAMVEDAGGALWMSANTGIVRLARDEFEKASADPAHQIRYRLFDASDGSAGVPTRSGGFVAARDKAGRLWFVTSNGLTVVDPTEIGEPRGVPPVRIESAVADARPVKATDGVRLPARTSHLQVEYTSLMLTDPTRARFRYRLDGFDTGWIDAGSSRQATYTNLPPGDYRFRVVASNTEDSWSEDGSAWSFSIEPTFYQTRAFYIGCLLLAVLLAWIIWHLRVRRVRTQFAMVLAERIRMSRTIHDTLLQGAVGLALQINDLSRSVDPASPASSQLSRIRRQIEEYIREARSSIWDLRSPKLESRDLPSALRDAAEQATADASIALDFSIVGAPRPVSARIEEQLLVIGQEAISNAIRHSQARRITVELRYEHDTIGVRVTDDGHGFDVEAARRTPGHYGLASMSERADEVHGSISVVSGPGRGTEIDAVVPVAS